MSELWRRSIKADGEEEEKERVTEEQMDGFRAFTEVEGGY